MSYERYEALLVSLDAGVATVTMNRGDSLNAFDETLHRNLEQVWLQLNDDPDVHVIILTGAGRAFSAGGNVASMMARFGTNAGRKQALSTTRHARRLCQNMIEVHQPVISAINGDAVGLGATVALLADMSVMNEAARLGDPHVKVGLVAGDGGALIWPLLIGPNRAKEFLFTGRLMTGTQAESLGLVNYAVPVDDVMPKAVELAREIARNPRLAVQWTKASVNKILKDTMNLVFDASIAWETVTMFTEDHHEATKAFVEKRRPNFTGS